MNEVENEIRGAFIITRNISIQTPLTKRPGRISLQVPCQAPAPLPKLEGKCSANTVRYDWFCLFAFYLLPFFCIFLFLSLSLSSLSLCLSLSTVHVCSVCSLRVSLSRVVSTCCDSSGLVVGLLFTRGQGLMSRLPAFSSRALVDGSGQQPTDTEVKSVLSCPLWPYRHRMCIIAERLGCLRWLAHAPRRGHFFGASTSWHTCSRCSDGSR